MTAILSHLKKLIIPLVIASFLAGTAFTVPNVHASAPGQAGTPPAPQSPSPASPNNAGSNSTQRILRLEKLYQREQKVLVAQGNRLDRVETLTGKAETLIQKLKGRGIDVTTLENALKDFQAAIPGAQAAHQSAAGILAAHAGFDVNGKVSDAKLAQQTVVDAGQALREAHRILQNAFRDLIREIRQFKRDNRPAPAASPSTSS